MIPVELSGSADPAQAAAALRSEGYAQVRGVLTQASAEALHETLKTLAWNTSFNDGEKNYEIPPDEAARLNPADKAALVQRIHARAARQYQFFYMRAGIVTPYFANTGDRGALAPLLEWLNGEAFLSFARTAFGCGDIKWADAQASLFGPGHFLNKHDDTQERHQRIGAYVLGLTKGWQQDFGGYLQFFDEEDNIRRAFRPAFNVLNLFCVPTPHSVAMVAPYAKALRYSVTGWLRADEPPGPFG